MAVDTVDIEFRARLDDFKKQVESLPGLTKKATRELTQEWVSQMKAAERAAGSSVERAAKEAEQLEKVATAIGGSIGDGIRQIGSLAKGAGASLSEIGMKMVAIGATVGAVYLLGSAIGGVLTNISAYKDAINSAADRDLVSDEQVKQLYAANAGWSKLGDQVSGFAVRIAAQVAPTFNKFVVGAAAALEYVTTLASTWSFDEAAESAEKAARQVFEAQQRAADLAEESKRVTGEWGNESEKASKLAESARSAAERATEAQRKQAEVERQSLQYSQWRVQVEAELKRQAEERQAVEARAVDIANRQRENIGSIQQAANAASEAYDQLGYKIDEVTGKTMRATDDITNSVQQKQEVTSDMLMSAGHNLTTNLVDLANTVADGQIKAAGRDEAAQRRIMRKKFAANKAAAISMAVINTAVGASKALADGGIAGIVLAALMIAAGAVQIGVIAAQQPTFHVGGIVKPASRAPDEVSATLMQGEGVLTRRGVDAVGGADAVQAANRGQAVGGSSSRVVAVSMLDGRVLDAVFAGTGPSGRGGLASRVDSRLRGGLSGRSQRGR